MTITVSAPNGITIQFPDTMDGEAISRVMAQHFGSPEVKAKYEPITTGGLVRAGAEGVPIIGGLLNKANAATYAMLAPLASGDETISHAPSFGGRYSENLAREEAKSAKFETEHPVAATAAGLVGGVGATLPLAATATGARMLGLGGTTLRGEIARGAASGAGINAIDALVRGGDPTTAGIVGGGLGAVAPPAARLVGAAVAPIASTVRGIVNPADEALRRVAPVVQRAQDLAPLTPGSPRNPMTPQEFQAAQAAGAPVNIMDVAGEPGRRLARSAVNTSDEGGAILNEAIDSRFQSQADRQVDWLRSTFNYPDAAAQQQALRESQSAGNNVKYARAMREGADGIWSPELERMASSDIVAGAMRKAASVARDESVVGGYAGLNPQVSFTPDGRIQFGRGPTGTPTYPDLQFWDLTRRQLSNSAQMARRAGDMEEARRFGTFAQRLNTELDAHVPSYATARAGHEAFSGAQDALEAGQNYAVQSRIDNRAAREALLRMTPQERGLFQDGFVDAMIQKIRSMPDRRNVAGAISNSPIAREQMDIALGPQRARELLAMLHLETVMNTARQAVQGNSTTARQLHELGLAGGAVGGLGAYGAYQNDPASIASAALLYGAARGKSAINERVARQVAQLLASNDLPRVRMGMHMLGANGGLLGNLRRASTAVARAGAAQTN